MPPETLDSLDKDELKALVLQLVAHNGQLIERLDDLLATNKTLLARIAELEAIAKANPRKTPANSSVQPSRGPKANRLEPVRKKGRRGRPGVARELCASPDARSRAIRSAGPQPKAKTRRAAQSAHRGFKIELQQPII